MFEYRIYILYSIFKGIMQVTCITLQLVIDITYLQIYNVNDNVFKITTAR